MTWVMESGGEKGGGDGWYFCQNLTSVIPFPARGASMIGIARGLTYGESAPDF
jgi:hypothetical protein